MTRDRRRKVAAGAAFALLVVVSLAAVMRIWLDGPDNVDFTVENATEVQVGLLFNAPYQSDGIYVAPGATATFQKPANKDVGVWLAEVGTFQVIGSTEWFVVHELPSGDFTIRVSGPPIAVEFAE